jgi:hypothetical protein
VDGVGLEFKATIGATLGVGADVRIALGTRIFKFSFTLGTHSIIFRNSGLALWTKELFAMWALFIKGLQGAAAVGANVGSLRNMNVTCLMWATARADSLVLFQADLTLGTKTITT